MGLLYSGRMVFQTGDDIKSVYNMCIFLADSDLGEMKVALDLLPADLQKCVNEDNLKFEREIREWDAEVQQRKEAQTTKSQGPSTQQTANTNIRGCKSEG